MKLKVTEKGVSQDGKDIEVGEFIAIAGDVIPPSLINKVVRIDGPTASAEPETDIEKMKVDELKAFLTANTVEIPVDAKKDDLLALARKVEPNA